jgi:hypothetical protein
MMAGQRMGRGILAVGWAALIYMGSANAPAASDPALNDVTVHGVFLSTFPPAACGSA